MRNRPHGFGIYLINKRQNHEDDCVNFCGLLKTAELYHKGGAIWPCKQKHWVTKELNLCQIINLLFIKCIHFKTVLKTNGL